MKQNCYTCAETQGECFDGVCKTAGEIDDNFAKIEHPDCWQKPFVCECGACSNHCKAINN